MAKLKKLDVTEISSVDHGATPEARVMIVKRDIAKREQQLERAFDALHESVVSIIDDDTYDIDAALAETFDQAQAYVTKLLTDTASAHGGDDATARIKKHAAAATNRQETNMRSDLISKDEVYEAIKTRALAQKRENESEAQAISRFIQSPDGKVWYRALKIAPGAVSAAAPVSVSKSAEPTPTPSQKALNALAEKLRKEHPELSFAQCFTKVLTDPANRALKDAEQTERRARVMKSANFQEQAKTAARERLEARASALSRSSGISHEDAFARTCAANPSLARAAGLQDVAA